MIEFIKPATQDVCNGEYIDYGYLYRETGTKNNYSTVYRKIGHIIVLLFKENGSIDTCKPSDLKGRTFRKLHISHSIILKNPK
jgi:hypothetical protein